MTATRVVIALFLSLVITVPAFAEGKDGMMQQGMMSGEMMESHKMMQEMMGMMKELMGMMKDFAHNPSSSQKKRLGEMMDKMDGMMKEHNDMMKNMEGMKGMK